MKNTLFMLVIGLFFGTGFGFLLAQGTGAGATSGGHDHSAHGVAHDDTDMAGHDHSALLEAGTPAPTVDFEAVPEGEGALNLHILTGDFTFAPEQVNTPAAPGQGHAHVYVDGVKVMRAYGPWVHLSGIVPGEVDIRVTLNANSHEQLATGGTPIEATRKVVVE